MKTNLASQIRGLADRVRVLNGVMADGQPVQVDLSATLDEVAKGINDPAAVAEAVKLYKEAWQDPARMRELCALRVSQTSNYILPSTNFMQLFFNTETLGEADRPVVQNTTKQEIRVGYIGQEGGVQCIKVEPTYAETMIPLHYVSSDKVNYRLTDIYNGSIANAAQATIDIGFDLANKIDKLCYDLLTAVVASGGAFGTFTFTGNKASRVYVANSRINTANLPSTNDITVGTPSTSTKFSSAVMRAIGKYGAQWAGAFPDGDLVPTGNIVLPALDSWDLAEEILPTDAGGAANSVAEELIRNGPMVLNYSGKRWVMIPDNTLAKGVAYAQYNKRPGTVFTKPALDQEFVDTQREKNIEFRWQMRVHGAYIASPHRLRAARFTYALAA